jgi:CRP-like cAMP-binding protein
MIATAFATHGNADRGTLGHDRAAQSTANFAPAAAYGLDELSARLITGATRSIDAKDHVFREGDAATHVYKVEYGMLPDGRRQVIDFAYPGDLIGLGALGEHAASAQATSRTSVRCIAVSALHEVVLHDAQLAIKLYEALSRELLAVRELLFTVSQRTASERLAGFLLALSRRNERRGESATEIVLPMTRSDIADFLGLTIETVSRTFTKFRNEGMIDLEQCILVTICNAHALADLAEGGSSAKG